MTKGLRIGQGVTLPLDAVTETFAILAKRGAGKTYTASVLAEEMLAAELQVVIVDPMSAWWGLRASADGKSPGFPIAVLGGPRGDVPLEATGGVVVADLVVGEQVSAIVDVSDFSKTERRRFVTDFLERLYQKNRDPMHVFLEEADLFAPQSGSSGRTDPENARMLGASYDLVRRGRGRGIGSTLITQRSASISKEVLEQAEILVALRTTGPRDRKAIEGWIDVHGEEEEQDKVMASLPGLPTGTAWVWWPLNGVLKQVRIRERQTFDSSATPKVGQRQRRPKTVAEVDLGALQAQMKETIERAKAEDPKELQKEIRRLKTELAKRSTDTKVEERVNEVEVRVEVPIFRDDEVGTLQKTVERLSDVGAQMVAVGRDIQVVGDRVASTLTNVQKAPPAPVATTRPRPSGPQRPRERPERASSKGSSAPAGPLPEGEPSAYATVLLETLARRHPTRLSRSQIATLSGRSIRSSAFDTAMGEIVRDGWAARDQNGFSLTEAGLDLVGSNVSVPQSGEELRAMWLRQLPRYESELLAVLIEAYPEDLSRQDLADRSNRSLTSSAFDTAISTLVKNRLAMRGQGTVRASDDLFPELVPA